MKTKQRNLERTEERKQDPKVYRQDISARALEDLYKVPLEPSLEYFIEVWSMHAKKTNLYRKEGNNGILGSSGEQETSHPNKRESGLSGLAKLYYYSLEIH